MKRRKPKRRNTMAASLRERQHRQRVVPSKKRRVAKLTQQQINRLEDQYTVRKLEASP